MALDPETLLQLIASVSRFTRERLIPLEAQVATDDRVPPEIVAEMRSMGLFGLTLPTEFGGLGLAVEEEVRVVFELAYAAPAFRSVIGTNNGIGSQGIVIAGTAAQKEKYLPAIAAGTIIASFALTEPESGSDAGSLRTRAVKTADGWRLTGSKRFITNAPEAALFTVFARTGSDADGAKSVSAFLVDRTTPGLSLGKPNRKMGQQGAHVCDVVFEDCPVPTDAMLGAPGSGFHTAMQVLDRGRLHLSAACVGLAERLIDEAVGYALERRQFGQAIAEFQLIQAMLADSRTDAYAGRTMVLETARRRDRGDDIAMEASCCKLFCSEMVGRIADRAVQIHGGAGYMAEYAVERLFRDARLFRIYEGTSQIQQLVIARAMLKRHGRGTRG
ncbi:MAG: acyl-CoA dehydrogenase [Alphaproteobacteria bacterium]|nr:acyl-CoA dehydrogenase [Alphaproteobacteria bacterium]